MSVSKDVIKQCLISKQREVDEAVIVNRPVEFEENGNYVIVGVRHAGKSYLLQWRYILLQNKKEGNAFAFPREYHLQYLIKLTNFQL